jgi:hypothetical protein
MAERLVGFVEEHGEVVGPSDEVVDPSDEEEVRDRSVVKDVPNNVEVVHEEVQDEIEAGLLWKLLIVRLELARYQRRSSSKGPDYH